MGVYTKAMEKLVKEMEKMPGVGPKTAERLAFHILNLSKEDSDALAKAIIDVKSSNANWVIMRPTWTFTRISPPIMEIVPSQDILYYENVNMIINTRNQEMKAALFPSANFDQDIDEWWINAQRDFSWWIVWFEQYEKFVLHHADIAARYGAESHTGQPARSARLFRAKLRFLGAPLQQSPELYSNARHAEMCALAHALRALDQMGLRFYQG